MTIDRLRTLLQTCVRSTYALSAVGAALRARVEGGERPSHVQAALDDVLSALEIDLHALDREAARPLLGEIRMALRLGDERVTGKRTVPGWTSDDPDLLAAAGEVSAGFPSLMQRIAPQLSDLQARLSSGGSFLDVGVGVGALSIAMAQRWPSLRIVGIDNWAPSLALARRRVAGAGMEQRITLREQGLEHLPDVAAFDLIWIPSAFIPSEAVRAGLTRARRALRSGGWLLFATANAAAPPLDAALARLRTLEWGGHPWGEAEIRALLTEQGLVDLQSIAGAPGSSIAFHVGRAPC
jgi:SAM-dependent methyltransferase